MHDKGVCFRTALGESLCGSLFLMHMSNLEKWRCQAPGGHWCQAPGIDRQLNNWLHDYLYKKNYPIETGRILREKYEIGVIWNEYDFKEVLNNVLSGGERS